MLDTLSPNVQPTFSSSPSDLPVNSVAEKRTQSPAPTDRLNSTAMTYLLNAKTLMRHAEYDLALRLLRQASNLNSKSTEVLKTLGSCLEKLGNWKEAAIVYGQLAVQHSNFEFHYRKGLALYFSNNDEGALHAFYESLAHLTEEREELFELYKNMGNIFVRQRDFDAAEEFYNKAFTLSSSSDVLLVNLGTLAVQRESFERALECFRNAVEVNPKNDKAWVGLALVHNHFGDSELAWGNLVRALDINPFNHTALVLMGHWGLTPDRIIETQERMERYINAFPFDEEISFRLIQIALQLKQYSRAETEIFKMQLWNPQNENVAVVAQQLKEQLHAPLKESA